MKHLRTATAVAAGLVVVTVVAGSAVSASGDEQSASAAGTSAAAASAAQEGCQEDLVREALAGFTEAIGEYDITYLKCAEGFGWATVDPIAENFDTATAILRVSGTEVEVLNLGTSICLADHGIPADVAAEIAPPGANPAGDCPAPAPTPVQAEPDFTG